MKNLFNRLNDRQKKLVKIIAAMLIVAVALFAVLQVLPRSGNSNNDMAKHETSSETSSSKESSKKNDDKKNQTSKKDDKKKDDTGKKEDKKEDTSTTSETPTTGTTSSETENNNSYSVTNTPTTTNTTPSQPEPQPIYQTIHHEEVGHWETQVVAEAWDEPVYERKIIGNNTGTVYASVDEFAFNTNGDEGYHVGNVQVGTTHHEAVTQQVWVVDQYAWDETIIVGYR